MIGPIRIFFGGCALAVATVVYSAGSATGVVSLRDISAITGPTCSSRGEGARPATPTMRDRNVDPAQRMAGHDRAEKQISTP